MKVVSRKEKCVRKKSSAENTVSCFVRNGLWKKGGISEGERGKGKDLCFNDIRTRFLLFYHPTKKGERGEVQPRIGCA